jgi:S1-C subfamily serine protease
MRYSLSQIFCIIAGFASIFAMSTPVSATEASIIKNVIKIKNYEARPDGSFVFRSYGSAIALSPSRILTNAHVITGADDLPTGHYEVCFSSDFEKVPVCRDTARLIAYDTVADLAILELPHTNTLTPFVLSSSKIAIGSYVSMYGYPGIGGETITRTDGKIA